jgi:hypothetical protein
VTYTPLVALRVPVLLAHLCHLPAPRASAREREAVVEQVAGDVQLLTGWDLDHLREQIREDTCTRHARFCCEDCFAM